MLGRLSFWLLGAALVGLTSCTHAPKSSRLQLEPVTPPPHLQDAANYKHLRTGLKAHITKLEKLALRDKKMAFGQTEIPLPKYIKSLNYLLALLPEDSKIEGNRGSTKEDAFAKALREKFDFYAYTDKGHDDPGHVKVTGYYTPLLQGATRPSARLSAPMYRPPNNLVKLRFNKWCQQLQHLSEKLNCDLVLRGRVNQKQQFVPYHARADMYKTSQWQRIARHTKIKASAARRRVAQDKRKVQAQDKTETQGTAKSKATTKTQYKSDGALRQRLRSPKQLWSWAPDEGVDLALVWLDPVDAFFLEIQGSGRVKLQNGKTIDIGYADQNGHPYRAIGRDLLDKIPIEQMSLQSIQAHLRSLSPRARQKVLNKNKSVVFFKVLKRGPQTAMGVTAVAGRSVAVDNKFFPRGALGFLYYQRPVAASNITPELNTTPDLNTTPASNTMPVSNSVPNSKLTLSSRAPGSIKHMDKHPAMGNTTNTPSIITTNKRGNNKKYPTTAESDISWQVEGRFVLAQDRGGAIKGPHKLDLYWGVGAEAEQLAGPMQHGGRVFWLVPKPEFLNGL